MNGPLFVCPATTNRSLSHHKAGRLRRWLKLNASLKTSKLLHVLAKLIPSGRRKIILLAGLVLLSLASARADNLITNGNFSPTGLTFTNNAATINTGPNTNTTTVPGWSVTAVTGGSNFMAQQGTSNGNAFMPNPPTGSIYGATAFSIAMDSAGNGSNANGNNTVSTNQTINLIAGNSYDLTFWINSESKDTNGANGTATLGGTAGITISSAKAAATTGLSTQGTATFSGKTVTVTTGIPATASQTQPWTKIDVVFKATSAGTLSIAFADTGDADGNNMQLSAISLATVVPEPSYGSLAFLFCIGFICHNIWQRKSLGRARFSEPGRQRA